MSYRSSKDDGWMGKMLIVAGVAAVLLLLLGAWALIYEFVIPKVSGSFMSSGSMMEPLVLKTPKGICNRNNPCKAGEGCNFQGACVPLQGGVSGSDGILMELCCDDYVGCYFVDPDSLWSCPN